MISSLDGKRGHIWCIEKKASNLLCWPTVSGREINLLSLDIFIFFDNLKFDAYLRSRQFFKKTWGRARWGRGSRGKDLLGQLSVLNPWQWKYENINISWFVEMSLIILWEGQIGQRSREAVCFISIFTSIRHHQDDVMLTWSERCFRQEENLVQILRSNTCPPMSRLLGRV